MHFLSSAKFDLAGEFEGFVRNQEGKRRILLRIGQKEPISLKLPKDLRKAFETRLRPGMQVAVLGVEYRDMFADRSKYVVSHLRLLSPALPEACAKCSIRVCAKKNCWKNGGEELFDQLQSRVHQLGLQDSVKIKTVGCLDHCKHGPNAECGKEVYERCDSKRADELIEQAVRQARRFAEK